MPALARARPKMRHRGRKRKPGRREPSGRIRAAAPEPNPIEQRRFLMMETAAAKRDARLSTPFGLVRARQLITEAEYQAGCTFEKRWLAAILPANPRSCLSGAVPGAETHDPSAADLRRYREACDALQTAGRRAFRQVIDTVCHKHWPRFLDTESRRGPGAWAADRRDLQALREGLAVLVELFKEQIDPDDRTVELADSVAAITALRVVRLSARKRRISMKIDDRDPQAELRQAIRRRRRALGLTQGAVAEKLGVPRLTYHRIETGARHIGFDELTALCELFAVRPETLLGNDLAAAYRSVSDRSVTG